MMNSNWLSGLPTKATSGFSFSVAVRQSSASVSDQRPAPTKANPSGTIPNHSNFNQPL